MITFKAIPSRYKRRDGLRAVSIRVTYDGRVRWLPTTIMCAAADLTRGGNIKSPDIIAKCNELTDRLRREAASLSPYDLEGRDVDWVMKTLSERMRAQDFRLDFFRWADTFLQSKTSGNRAKYETALNAFARYLGRREIDINEITHAMLVQFADAADSGCKLAYSRRKGIIQTDKPRTGKISPHYLAHLSHIYDGAKDRYNDEDGGAVVIPRSPFRKLDMTPPKPKNAPEPLDVSTIQAMIDTPLDSPRRASLDVFLASFLLMGVNAADLWEATPPKGKKWVFFRKKTRNRRDDHARIECAILPVLWPYLRRLGAGTSSEWWLPRFHERGKDASIAGQSVNYHLKKWAAERGMAEFTLGSARHSWATLTRKCRIEKATADDGMGHVGEYRVFDIYAVKDWDAVAEANAKVAALFRWPE